MKKHILTSLALILILGTLDASAQSLLKKLGQQALKEVGTRVENHVKTEVQKTVSNPDRKPKEAASQEDFYDKISKRAQIATIATMVEYGSTTGELNGYAWVDLGLPSGIRWATCNVDAISPEHPGKHYSWGEVATKSSYLPENTKTYGKEIVDISGLASPVNVAKFSG